MSWRLTYWEVGQVNSFYYLSLLQLYVNVKISYIITAAAATKINSTVFFVGLSVPSSQTKITVNYSALGFKVWPIYRLFLYMVYTIQLKTLIFSKQENVEI